MEKDCIAHITESVRKWASPGPAHYHIKRRFKNNCPPILMRSRHPDHIERLDPALVNLKGHFGRVPKVHLHYRTDTQDKFIPPGPNYMPPAFGVEGHKVGFPRAVTTAVPRPSTSRPLSALTPLGLASSPEHTPGPGPGKYSTRWQEFDGDGKNGQSIIGEHDFEYDKIHSPGPAAYRPRYEKILPVSARYTIKHQPKAREPKVTGEYRALKSTLAGYKYSMKARPTDEVEVH
jgi:hypothetical protein